MLSNHHQIVGHVFLVLEENDSVVRDEAAFIYVSIDNEFTYHGFCDDFGPMNLSSIYRFCKMVVDLCEHREGKQVALTTDNNQQSITNAVLLLGAYIILHLGEDPLKATSLTSAFTKSVVSYRDISPGKQNFHLHLEDCWQALHKAQTLGWIDLAPNGFDVDEYDHYDNPCNADLHVIVPNKIVAMKGPASMEDGQRWSDRPDGSRFFSVEHYAEILADFDLQLVVRLNKPEYSAQSFNDQGIALADLFFEDCTIPPDDVVVKFLLILENLPGAAAVHCKAGLGRTGTLIALYLMKNFAFTARQAIAWLRIVRPGSVIGRQQQYLCEMEPRMTRLRGHPLSGPFVTAAPPLISSPTCCLRLGVAAVDAMVARVHRRVEEGQRKAASPSPAGPVHTSLPPSPMLRGRREQGIQLRSCGELSCSLVARNPKRRNSYHSLRPTGLTTEARERRLSEGFDKTLL